MARRVICLGERVRRLGTFLPRVVTIRPALDSFERDFLTKVGSALTFSASIAEGISSPRRKPRAAMMCAATVNWTLVADISPPPVNVMFNSTMWIQVFSTDRKWSRARNLVHEMIPCRRHWTELTVARVRCLVLCKNEL